MEKIIRCNHCANIFYENKIIFKEENNLELCPFCHQSGALMDLTKENNEEYTVLLRNISSEEEKEIFPLLSQCRDFKILKKNLDEIFLIEMENDLNEYEYIRNGESEDFHSEVISWYEGLITTAEIISYFKKEQ